MGTVTLSATTSPPPVPPAGSPSVPPLDARSPGTIVAGAVCEILGLVVLAGWLLPQAALVYVVPSDIAMQANAALGFVLCGAGLLALGYGRPRAAVAFGALIVALATLTILEQLTGLDLRIDRMLLRASTDPSLLWSTGPPGRMSPHTATALALGGLAIGLAGSRSARLRRARPIGLALLGAAVVALGAVAVLGYVVVSRRSGWGGASRVALPTAAGLVTLGIGLLSLRLPREGAVGVRPRTIAVAVGTISAALLMAQALDRSERQAVSQRLWDHARAIARYVEDRMTSAVDAAEKWAAEARDAADPPEHARRQARGVLGQLAGATGVAWLRPDGTPAWTVPGGLDPAPIERALGGRTRPTSVLVRLPGSEDVLVAAPVRRGDDAVGTLAVVVDLRRRVASHVLEALAGDDDVDVEEGGRRVVSLDPLPASDASLPGATSPLRPRGSTGPWALTVRSRTPGQHAGSALPLITLLGGGALGAVLAFALHLGDRAAVRALDAERATANLLLEVEYRRRIEEERDNFFTISADLLCVTDLEGRFLQVNDAWRRTLGVSLDEMHRRPVIDFVHPDDRPATLRVAVALARGRPVSHFENRCQSADGSYRWLQWSAAPVVDRERIYAIARDVTDQRLVTEALKSREEQFRAVAETANDAIVCCDRDGRISYFNRAAERIFRWSAEQVEGEPLTRLLPERLVEQYHAVLDAFLATGRGMLLGRTVELVGRRKDGAEFPLEVSVAGWTTEEGPFFAGILREVTERKRAEAELRKNAEDLRRTARELERSNEELQQFAYVASHDLQEPLRMVASYTDLLGERYRGRLDADADEFIGYAVDGARRMQQLIQDLLEYARVGTRGKAFGSVDLRAAVDRALWNLRPRIEESGAEVVVEDLPTVVADEGQMVQLVQNLVGNAIKFRGTDPPRVVVSCARAEGEWVLSVADNGIGISPEHFERVFQVFQRLHGRGEYPGTGIGLAICKRIADRHGGRIWITSEPGRGATFHVAIPVREPEAVGAEARPAAART